MSSVNKAIVLGRLGADPDIRTMGSGDRVANFRLATSEKWKDSNGEKHERTEWHTVTVWNDGLVRVIEQYVKKGSQVYIEGQLQTRKWQDQNGVDRYSTEIVLKKYRGELVLLGGKNEDSDQSSSRTTADDYANASGGSYTSQTAQTSHQRPLDDEQDIPF